MRHTDTIVIGAGQAGLALSRCLSERGHDHALLERGRIAERWRTRWDTLRLLTPNWMSRLPGRTYDGPDPDGFMSRADVVEMLAGYARSFDAPVHEETTVLSAAPRGGGWRVVTDQGEWRCDNVVVATGACARPRIPAFAADLPGDVAQISTTSYRNPGQLPAGGVLVVGASASGVQLADEIRRSGREVTIAVGRHNRLPRRYRGLDVMRWLDRIGTLDRAIEEMPDPETARREPSLQLVGGDRAESLDLGVLAARGVRLAGRLIGFEGSRARFAGDLAETTAAADAKLRSLLARIDRHAAATGLARRLPPPALIRPLAVGPGPAEIDLAASGIRTVLWATGYRRDYSWLEAPALDARGEIVHRRGRSPIPGLYVLGLQFLTRRKSSFLDGVGLDAFEIANQITSDVREAVA